MSDNEAVLRGMACIRACKDLDPTMLQEFIEAAKELRERPVTGSVLRFDLALRLLTTPQRTESDSTFSSEAEYQRTYLGEPWVDSEKEQKLLALAAEYHQRNLTFARHVRGHVMQINVGGSIPNNAAADMLNERNSSAVLDDVRQKAEKLGFSLVQLERAIEITKP